MYRYQSVYQDFFALLLNQFNHLNIYVMKHIFLLFSMLVICDFSFAEKFRVTNLLGAAIGTNNYATVTAAFWIKIQALHTNNQTVI